MFFGVRNRLETKRTTCALRSMLADITGGADVIRKEAWPFYRTISGVRLCWELENPKGPKGHRSAPDQLFYTVGYTNCCTRLGTSIALQRWYRIESGGIPQILNLTP